MSGLLQPGSRLIDAASGETIGGADLRARVAGVAARLGALPPGALFARTSIEIFFSGAGMAGLTGAGGVAWVAEAIAVSVGTTTRAALGSERLHALHNPTTRNRSAIIAAAR